MENKKTALELIPNVMHELGLLSIHDLKAYTTYEMLTLLSKRVNQLIKEMIQFESDSIETLKTFAILYNVSAEHFPILVLPLQISLSVACGTPLSFANRYLVICLCSIILLISKIITSN